MIVKKAIVVVGTGYVGLPAALMWAQARQRVIGVDINENLVRAINDGTMRLNEATVDALLNDPLTQENLTASTVPQEADVFVIAVPTPVDPLKKICDLRQVESAIESIAPFLRQGNLLIVESTVPPLTCRNVVGPLVKKITGLSVPGDILLAHCPERILPGDVFKEIVHNDRLIGGVNQASTLAARELYALFVKGALHETDDLTAELSKLMENAYRDVNIALANEFRQICELLGANWRDVIGFANKHPRVNILTPGIGVGGHCIPVDPWFLKEAAPYNSRLITVARNINDEMPHEMAAKIRRIVAPISDPRIVALGATYKRNCDDMRESPAVEIVSLLRMDGYSVNLYDPLVTTMNYESVVSVANGADLLVILVNHDKIRQEVTDNREQISKCMRSPNFLFLDEG